MKTLGGRNKSSRFSIERNVFPRVCNDNATRLHLLAHDGRKGGYKLRHAHVKLTHLSALTLGYDVSFLPFERAERLTGAFLVVDGGRKGFERLEREKKKRNAVVFVKFRFRRDFIREFCRKVWRCAAGNRVRTIS